jgi:hypothetical protein
MRLRTEYKKTCKFLVHYYVCIVLYNLSMFWLHEFLYREIIREWQNSQVFWIDLLIRILGKLSLYFSEVYTIFYEFWKFKLISGIFKRVMRFKNEWIEAGLIRPEATTLWCPTLKQGCLVLTRIITVCYYRSNDA